MQVTFGKPSCPVFITQGSIALRRVAVCWDIYLRTLGYGFVEPAVCRSPLPVLQLLRPAESWCIYIPPTIRKQYTQRLRGGGITERPPGLVPSAHSRCWTRHAVAKAFLYGDSATFVSINPEEPNCGCPCWEERISREIP